MRTSLALLHQFGCVAPDANGQITERGKLFSELEMDPRLSVLVVDAYERFGLLELPCRVAAVLAETGSGSLFFFGNKQQRAEANRNIGEQASHFSSDVDFYQTGWENRLVFALSIHARALSQSSRDR